VVKDDGRCGQHDEGGGDGCRMWWLVPSGRGR
jgi:hypothetical protein